MNNPLNHVDPFGQTSSVTIPSALPVLIADQGFQIAIDTFATAMVIQYIFNTQGQDIVVDGQTRKLLPDYDPNDPNTKEYGPQTRSFDEIMDDEELFREWADRDTFNGDRRYNVYDALRIWQNFEKWYGGPPEIDPPQKNTPEHMHPPGRRNPNPHIPLTKKAYDYLMELFG
jgi:hypothetical protein